ncbi:anti-sigma factor family protein [Micromonospora profundi]|uniref:anti-sigma factor family protein n=1 Tax=Micromonospora TaxID=1873 RepID=UPI0033A9C661
MHELTCAQMVESITDYLEGTLPPDELESFRAHLLCCDGCDAYLDQMQSTVRLLRSAPGHRLPVAVESAIVQTFREWNGTRAEQ